MRARGTLMAPLGVGLRLPLAQHGRPAVLAWGLAAACQDPAPAPVEQPTDAPIVEQAAASFDCIYDRTTDADLDGYPGCVASVGCSCASLGWWAFDCDDQDPTVRPVVGADPWVPDPIDGADNDCDAVTDEDERMAYLDVDHDGYPREEGGIAVQADVPSGDDYLVVDPGSVTFDCDDTRAAVNPGATEIPNDSQDRDCDGFESCFEDLDHDGFGSEVSALSENLLCGAAGVSPLKTDCDDHNVHAHPGTNVQSYPEFLGDNADNDCDGQIDEMDCGLSLYASLANTNQRVDVFVSLYDADGNLMEMGLSRSGTVIQPGFVEWHPGDWWWSADARDPGAEPVLTLDSVPVGLIRISSHAPIATFKVQGVRQRGTLLATLLPWDQYFVWPTRGGLWPYPIQLPLYTCNASEPTGVRACSEDGLGVTTCVLDPIVWPVPE